MIVVISLVAAGLGAAAVWAVLGVAFSSPRFVRTNFRGSEISGVGGVALVVAVSLGCLVLLMVVPLEDLPAESSFGGFQLGVGFGILGFLDDVSRQQGGGGFRGHLRALRDGKVTTGLVKLAGGVVLSLLVAALVSKGGAAEVLRDAGLLAAGANLANLFDRAPGRSLKVATIAGVAMVAAVGLSATLAYAALAIGAGVGLAAWEMREKMMLGDTGANAMGAMVALSGVTTLGNTSLWVIFAVVVFLNLVSDAVSFTSVINKVGPLRWLDRLGRPAP